MTSKNWLDFGGDYITLGFRLWLGLQTPWQRFAPSECSLCSLKSSTFNYIPFITYV